MAEINITLNYKEILQLLEENQEGAFKKIMEKCLNQFLLAESTEQLKAEPYERTEKRTDCRNGSYQRMLTTRIGSLILTVPRHRNAPFKTMVFDNYCTSESALITTMAEMVINGVSTRKVSNVMETICGRSFSKSTVSEATKELDKIVGEFQNKRLVGSYPFLMVDATYFKVREDHKIISKALFVAYAVSENGVREIVGFKSYPSETKDAWLDFIRMLKDKGLSGVKFIISDAHEGIKYALSKEFPFVPWQRCQQHFRRNIVSQVPSKFQKGITNEIQAMFNAPDINEARRMRDEIINDYRDIAEKAMECLDEGFEQAMSAMALPQELRATFRTSNTLERLNRELKRRSDVIGIFPNEGSLNRLMGAVLMELDEQLQAKRHRVFYKASKIKLEESENELRRIGEEQRAFMVS